MLVLSQKNADIAEMHFLTIRKSPHAQRASIPSRITPSLVIMIDLRNISKK